jgi:predicted transcriptional regulator
MPDTQPALSRRERQIMDVVYQLGEADVADVASRLPDRPAYNTVRVTLGILERKGHVVHRRAGARYVYAPTVPVEKARRSAMRHVLATFFKGSPSAAILTLLDGPEARLSRRDLDQIARAIAQARKKEGD